MLRRSAGGFGALALAGLLAESAAAGADGMPRGAHFAPKARSVIFLYMDGGPSQMDTFDPKPRLQAEHGQPFKMKMEPTQFNNNGLTLGSPWKFAKHCDSGLEVSELFPHVARCADDLTVIRSMTSEFSEHTSANYFLHTGAGIQGRPTAGAWTMYGLGSPCQNLPGFVVLNGGLIPPGGIDNFGNGYLPATCQASLLRPEGEPVANLRPLETLLAASAAKINLRQRLDRFVAERFHHADPVEAAIANYELAYRMQAAIPELVDLADETAATRRLYGLDAEYAPTRTFGAECLLARRLVERGVRFVELTCPAAAGIDRWDQHARLVEGHQSNARAVDQPIAGLLTDLKARGLLDETLVWWSGEFGRTPFAQGVDGRDHNPFGFTCWLAGGGVRRGTVYGATDEYGYKAVEDRVEMHDLHATILHLLGIDHERLTFRFSGRDMRLTDVAGRILHGILA
ncbi:DUF1501 domain-containing protein [Lacipirellula limnantheis]|uniref:Sulfatase n=1 Tax=Lacipirellula limnantheis TaxID=2528024 RepID=A0A517TZT1_9BACT|nr:DUF1501 domain-containing protein [Lacipirellula limnantheis]QDT73887.1 hypothetical protein I41_30780 [Lacipirellula limnantheis]